MKRQGLMGIGSTDKNFIIGDKLIFKSSWWRRQTKCRLGFHRHRNIITTPMGGYYYQCSDCKERQA